MGQRKHKLVGLYAAVNDIISLQTVWRTNTKGDVGIYILDERPLIQELYNYNSLGLLKYFPGAVYNICKLLYFIALFLLIVITGIYPYVSRIFPRSSL